MLEQQNILSDEWNITMFWIYFYQVPAITTVYQSLKLTMSSVCGPNLMLLALHMKMATGIHGILPVQAITCSSIYA